MILTQTWAIGLLLNSHTVKHANCYPSCEHSRINILQWILTKLGTYLVLKRIWNPIDFQSQRSRSPGQIFRRNMQIAMDLHIISYHTFKIQTKQGQSVAYPLA
jgi:hypothetical protein